MRIRLVLILSFLSAMLSDISALDVHGIWELNENTVINEDLHIFPEGVIRPGSASGTTVYISINGSLINEGSIENLEIQNKFLDLNLTGDLINSGKISNKTVNFNGTITQQIATTSTTPFRTKYFNVNNPIALEAISDLHFMNSYIRFLNGGGFNLASGCDIYIKGGFLNGAEVNGPEHYVKSQTKIDLNNDAYITNSTLNRVDTDGIIIFNGNCVSNGPFTNFGTIKPYLSTSQAMTVNGDFVNIGTVTGDNLSFQITGALTNEGTFSNYSIIFTGAEAQHVKCNYPPIQTDYIFCTNPEGIILDSDLRITGSGVADFGISFGNNPINSNGFDIYAEALSLNDVFLTGQLENGLPTSSLYYNTGNMGSSTYLRGCTMSNMNLYGTLRLFENLVFEGTIINYSEIYNIGYNSVLAVNGNLYNSVHPYGYAGTINNGFESNLTVFAKGNLHNSSVFNNSRIVFSGTGEQNISCAHDKPFTVGIIESTNPNEIRAASDLYFSGTGFDLTGHSLDLNGNDLYLSGGYLDSAVVLSSDSLSRSLFTSDSLNSCFVESSIINGIDLNGTFRLKGSNVKLNGKVTNYGNIMNVSTGNSYVTLLDDFINKGIIKDNGLNYKLTTNIKGNITNYGTWINNYINFNGIGHQSVLLPDGTEIAGSKIAFVADTDSIPYEWFYNGQSLVGNSNFDDAQVKILCWGVPIDLSYSGFFYCDTREGISRKISIYANGLPSPVLTEFTIENGNVGLAWNPVTYTSSYKVFSTDDPYKDHSSWFLEGETASEYYTIWNQTAVKKFYFVKAVY